MKKLLIVILACVWTQAWCDSIDIYSDAGTGSTTVDGQVGRSAISETYASIISGAGNTANATDTSMITYLQASNTVDQFAVYYRGFITFDTSVIAPRSIINAANLVLWGIFDNAFLGDTNLDIIPTSPAANNNLVSSDYDNITKTLFATATRAQINTGQYNTIALNATGVAYINPKGITPLGFIQDWDFNNAFTGTWLSGSSTYMYFASADTAGTGNDPYLTVNYSPVPVTIIKDGIFTGGIVR